MSLAPFERFVLAMRARRVAAWVVALMGVSLATRAVLMRLGYPPARFPILVGMVAGLYSIGLFRRHRVDVSTVAAQFDRTHPELEESAALLERDEASLSPMERLQQRRVLAAWETTTHAIPGSWVARRGLLVAAAGFAVALLAWLLPTSRGSRADHDAKAPSADGRPVAIDRVVLRWTPPAYTGRPARDAVSLDATVEAGSAVAWRIAAPRAARVRLVSAKGDTLEARAQDAEWRVERAAASGMVWHAEALDAANHLVKGEEHLLAVVPDREPVVAILAPAGRVELEWREPHAVVVRALASDDYGLSRVRLAATVAKGRGEGVKFKESWLSVDVESRRDARSQVVSRLVHLDSLGVEPGDEVFLAFEATDNRAPSPQAARSETIFLSLLDTLDTGSGTLAGVAIKVEPAYFRSQRQIILDTEALLRDVREGRVRDGGFARSLEIGLDQHLLRQRYGAMVGEENSENEGPDQDISGRHEHDMAENATLLSPTVKGLLKDALGQMWDAERRLRTGQAKDALAYEYRALASLEEIRRAERSYVKRIGFEPKPIDVARTRLTKQAQKLGSLALRDSTVAGASEPLLRDALAGLETPLAAASRGAFDAAARRLAERALESEPGVHLETLRALRRLIDGPCVECVAVARRGLLAALPTAERPIRPMRAAHGALPGRAP